MTAEQARDLLEIVEDRYDAGTILLTSQVPVDRWHDMIGVPTLADAILDRLVHNAYRSNSPARACASGNPHDTAPTITPTSTIPLTSPPNANIINMTRGNAQPRGRHHVGTLAGFKSEWVAGFRLECMAGFVGIRTVRRPRSRGGELGSHRLTCRELGVDPQAYFADVLTKLVNLWPASRLDELIPWALGSTAFR